MFWKFLSQQDGIICRLLGLAALGARGNYQGLLLKPLRRDFCTAQWCSRRVPCTAQLWLFPKAQAQNPVSFPSLWPALCTRGLTTGMSGKARSKWNSSLGTRVNCFWLQNLQNCHYFFFLSPWKTPLHFYSKGKQGRSFDHASLKKNKLKKKIIYIFWKLDNFSQTRGTEFEQDPWPLEGL